MLNLKISIPIKVLEGAGSFSALITIKAELVGEDGGNERLMTELTARGVPFVRSRISPLGRSWFPHDEVYPFQEPDPRYPGVVALFSNGRLTRENLRLLERELSKLPLDEVVGFWNEGERTFQGFLTRAWAHVNGAATNRVALSGLGAGGVKDDEGHSCVIS